MRSGRTSAAGKEADGADDVAAPGAPTAAEEAVGEVDAAAPGAPAAMSADKTRKSNFVTSTGTQLEPVNLHVR